MPKLLKPLQTGKKGNKVPGETKTKAKTQKVRSRCGTNMMRSDEVIPNQDSHIRAKLHHFLIVFGEIRTSWFLRLLRALVIRLAESRKSMSVVEASQHKQ